MKIKMQMEFENGAIFETNREVLEIGYLEDAIQALMELTTKSIPIIINEGDFK